MGWPSLHRPRGSPAPRRTCRPCSRSTWTWKRCSPGGRTSSRSVEYVICPNCQNLLHTVQRRGVHLEQCESCRGIFLDHGELEQIVNAENAYYAAPADQYQPPPGAPVQPRHYGTAYRDSPGPYRGGYPDSPRPYQHG